MDIFPSEAEAVYPCANRVVAYYEEQPLRQAQTYVTKVSWYKHKSGFEHEFVIVVVSYLDSDGERQTICCRLERSIFNRADRVSADCCQPGLV